jgi:hypothetical protein
MIISSAEACLFLFDLIALIGHKIPTFTPEEIDLMYERHCYLSGQILMPDNPELGGI